MLQRTDLRQYQRRAVEFLKRRHHAGLFLDMGLGKTISTLTAVADLLDKGVVTRVLLVAPLRPAQGVWRQEARKWQHTRKLTFKLLTGNERQRLLAMKSSAQVHIINVDNLRWLMAVLQFEKARNGWPYDMLVIDESSMFKTPKAKRFVSLRTKLHHFQRRVILTGTPAPKGLLDLWSQIFILDEGVRLGAQVGRFRSRFFSPTGYKGYGYEPDADAEQAITNLISPLILTMRAEDYLDLPPVIENVVHVDLPPAAMVLYSKMEKEMFLELELGTSEAVSAASVSAKCWQIANGALIVDQEDGTRTWQPLHDAKLEALHEILEGTGDNVLVAYWFKHDLARLKKAFPKAPVFQEARNERAITKMQDEWNAGQHRVGLIHPQSVGHGMNLQDGGHTMAFFSMLWGREAFAQVKERMGAARQVGKADRVIYHYIVARNTVDAVMYATQRQRHDNERRYMEMLKDYHAVKEILAPGIFR